MTIEESAEMAVVQYSKLNPGDRLIIKGPCRAEIVKLFLEMKGDRFPNPRVVFDAFTLGDENGYLVVERGGDDGRRGDRDQRSDHLG